MNAPLYTTEILRLAASLPEPVDLEREDGSAELRSATCGSRVATVVELAPDGTIVALSQRVHACAFGQASASMLQQTAPGRAGSEIDQALGELSAWLGGGEVPDWPAIAALAPARNRTGRHAAILLPFRSLAAALADAADRRRRGSPPAP